MKFLLVITLFVNQTYATTSVVYPTKAACEAAKQSVKSNAQVSTVCLERGKQT